MEDLLRFIRSTVPFARIKEHRAKSSDDCDSHRSERDGCLRAARD